MKKLVVIGGGYGGISIAHKLKDDFTVTIIDRNNYFNQRMSGIRAGVVPGWEDKALTKFSELATYAKFMQAIPKSINTDSKTVELDDTSVSYDYLVIATGSTYYDPIENIGNTIAEAKATLQTYQNKVKDAKSYIIIGDGAIGYEMAGELRAAYGDKKITLIGSNSAPLSAVGSDKLSAKLTTLLSQQNVTHLSNTKAVKQSDTSVKLDNGKILKADLVITAIGAKPNTEWLKPNNKNLLDEKGFIKVDDYLRVEGTENVFALGDCADVAEPKMVVHADKQSKTVVSNLKAVANGKELKKHKIFNKKLSIIPFGPSDGVSLLPIGPNGVVAGKLITSLMKSKKLFTNMYPKKFAGK